MQSTVTEISSGRPGTMQTLRAMRRLVERGKRSPIMRRAMMQEALAGIPERDPDKQIDAVARWVMHRYRYVHDPVGVEQIQAPEITLGLDIGARYGHGDCDDAVVALSTALEQIGYRTRFHVMGQGPDELEHVMVEVFNPRTRRWMTLDPTAKHKPVGWSPSAPYRERTDGRLGWTGAPAFRTTTRYERGLIQDFHGRPSGYDFGRRRAAPALFGYRERGPFGGITLGDMGGLAGMSHAINVGAHQQTLALMRKFGGGAVLGGSRVPAPGTVWRHDPSGMCGPHACMDCTDLSTHPWVVNGDGAAAYKAVEGFIWYKPTSTDPAKLSLWDESGGVVQYLCWLDALDVEEGEVSGLPAGYVTEGRKISTNLVQMHVYRAKRRVEKKKKAAKVLKIASIGVGSVAALLTAGIGAGLIGASLPAATAAQTVGAGAITGVGGGSAVAAGGTGIWGVAAFGSGLAATGLDTFAARRLQELGVKQSEIPPDLTTKSVAAVATGDPFATTGDSRIDQVILELRQQLAQVQADSLRRSSFGGGGTGSSGNVVRADVATTAPAPKWSTPITVAATLGGVAVLGLVFMLARKK